LRAVLSAVAAEALRQEAEAGVLPVDCACCHVSAERPSTPAASPSPA
jgi:hypothetical protein